MVVLSMLDRRIEIGEKFNKELAKQGSDNPYEDGSYNNHVSSAEEEFGRIITRSGTLDRARPDDITEHDNTKKKVFKGSIGRARSLVENIEPQSITEPVEWNDTYNPIYPMTKKIIEQIEHIVFNRNGQFSPNGHTENGHVDTSKIE